MTIQDLTIKEAKQKLQEYKELQELFNIQQEELKTKSSDGLSCQIGEKVIIRTYSAGVWFGTLEQKSGNEVILKDARRMYQWWAAKSISLSGVAVYGIKQESSKICPAISKQWLEAIEIISLTDIAIKSIEEAKDVEVD